MSMLTPPGTGGTRRPRSAQGPVMVGVVVLALVLVAAVAGWLWSSTSDTTETAAPRSPDTSCPAPQTLAAPPPPGLVRINVYNATTTTGLAARVAARLERRGFRVASIENDPTGRTVSGAVELRHGPNGEPAARTIRAQLPPKASITQVTLDRSGKTVDVVIGETFDGLVSADEAARILRQPAPQPTSC